MTYKWKLQKGMRNTCPKCHGTFDKSEYDLVEDLCHFCLFPEAARARPADIGYFEGVAKNTTAERILLDNIHSTPEKMTKVQEARLVNFKATGKNPRPKSGRKKSTKKR